MNEVESKLLDINLLLEGSWKELSKLLLFFYGKNDSKNRELDKNIIDTESIIKILREKPINIDQNILEQIEKNIGHSCELNNESTAILKFIDVLFENYINNSKLKQDLKENLKTFRGFACIKLLQHKMPWDEESALKEIFNTIYTHSIGWHIELGRASDRYLDQLTSLIHTTASNIEKESDSCQQLNDFFNKEEQRINKLEKRLYDTEIGSLKAAYAHQITAKNLNQLMAGKKLPKEVIEFLQGPMYESIRLIVLNNGEESSEWSEVIHLSKALILSFQLSDSESVENQQNIYHSIAELTDQLKEVTVGLHYSSQIDLELSLVEKQLLKVLKHEPVDHHPFELIENKNPLVNSQMSISSSLIKKVNNLSLGQWFIVRSESGDSEKTIKLIAKIAPEKQLLFSNFIGIKSAQYNVEEFAYLLSSGTAVMLPSNDNFKSTAENILKSLQQSYNEKQQEEKTEELERQLLLNQQEKERRESREKALQEALLAKKAYEDAERQRKEDETKDNDIKALKTQTDEAIKTINKLKVGAVVIFYENDNKRKHCKLAAILQSSNKYIFTNNAGIKQHSLSKLELATRLTKGYIKVFDFGSNFDRTLEQVVTNLRKR